MKINIIKKLEQKKSVILKVKISSDLTTPVLTFLKLKKYFPKNNFLYESVEKGKNRARFSIIGLKPDLMWKIKDKIPILMKILKKTRKILSKSLKTP